MHPQIQVWDCLFSICRNDLLHMSLVWDQFTTSIHAVVWLRTPWQTHDNGIVISDKLCRNDFLHRVWFGIDYSHENFRLLFGNSMVVIQTLFTKLTPLCHMCWMVYSLTVTYDWFLVICRKSWRVPHVGQEMLTLSGTHDFTPFGEFMISPILYIYIIYYWIC